MCWVSIIVAMMMAIVGELIRPKQKSNTGKPAGLGDFQFPTSEAGRVIPWICGTVKILGPNNVARDDLSTRESYKRVKTGWFSTAKQSFGFQYRIGLQFVFCLGSVDQLVGFQVNDTFLKTSSITVYPDYIDCYIADEGFYGNPMEDGGFAGLIRIYRGTGTQPADDYLRDKLLHEDQISAYPDICHAVFYSFYVGMSPNPPAIIPILSRWPNGLGVAGGKHIVDNTGSNVMCAVYDFMTHSRGLAIPTGKIDTPAFLAAASVVYDEHIGINVILDSMQNGDDAVKSLMAYADGVVFEDPFTSLWTVKLARADYVVDNLPVLDESNSRCVGRTKTDWMDTRNTISIGYLDKSKNWTNQSVTVLDQGNLIAQNQQASAEDIDMTGVDNFALANFMAERTRVAKATPFTHMEIEAQGIGDTMKINDPIVVKYPTTKRIALMVVRIMDIEYPNSDDAVTKISVLEDKYGVSQVAYVATPPTPWIPPAFVPLPALYQTAMELPYPMTPDLSQNRYVLTAAVRAGSVEQGYGVYAGATLTNDITDLTSGGKLLAPLSKSGPYTGIAAFTIYGVVDILDVTSASVEEFNAGLSLMKIDDELIAFRTAVNNGDGSITVSNISRSVYDTVPANHAADAPVFFLSSGAGLAQNLPYASDALLSLKYAMRAQGNELPLTSATAIPLQLASRATRPYPPGNLTINAVNALGLTVADDVVGDMAVTWAHRDRLASGRNIVAYTGADIGPEAGVTYTVKIYIDNVLKSTSTGLTGDTLAVLALSVDGVGRMEVSAQRSGLNSQQILVSDFTYYRTQRRITESGDTRITENGIQRIVES